MLRDLPPDLPCNFGECWTGRAAMHASDLNLFAALASSISIDVAEDSIPHQARKRL
jgi:hypothetical protein